jgi:hypothetical protein
MSIAEMKLAAIQEIGMLNNQDAVKEILEHLEKLEKAKYNFFLALLPITFQCKNTKCT